MSIFLSNRLELLVDSLTKSVYSGLARRKVVVPDGKMKNYLLLALAERSPQQVALGMEILQRSQVISGLLSSESELALRLEYQMKSLLDTPLFASLAHYLCRSATPLPTLSSQLARVFLRYALYGGGQLREWLKKEGWQQELFRKFDFSIALPEGVEWHLFGFHDLPLPYLEAFRKAGARCYFLSPCAHYWEDFCNERERVRLKSRLNEEQQEALEEYLNDQNPLLANMGKVGRQFLHRLSNGEQDEFYVEPEGGGCLAELQRSLLNLEAPQFDSGTDEVRLYASSSPLHEVETLYSELAMLMEREGIEPSEIQVIAPDIAHYAPYIHMVFGREGGAIPYSLSDIPLPKANVSAAEFLQLLDLNVQRFTPQAFHRLISGSSFQAKHGLLPGDAQQILRWAEAANVHWGIDHAHRKQLFNGTLLEESEAGTWKKGFEKLLLGMAMIDPALPSLDPSEGELLEKGIALMEELKQDLEPLMDGGHRTASEWLALLRKLAEKHFSFSEEEAGWLRKLKHLEVAVDDLTAPLFSFDSIRELVQKILQDSSGGFRTACLQSVLFSSLPKGAMPPKKAIWFLGMQEESFPRREKISPLSLFPLEQPSQADVDRYLFLDILLAAREHLFFSYVKISPKDHKLQAPSLLIQELFSYLGKPVKPKEPPKASLLHFRKSSSPLFRSFYEPVSLGTGEQEEEVAIDLRVLEKCARHPIEFYLQQTLGIYLERTEEREGEFCLSNISKAKLRKDALSGSLDQTLEEAERYGALPLGRLKDAARIKIEEELKAATEEIRGPLLSRSFNRSPFALELEKGRRVLITGKLSLIAEEGMVFYGENKLEDLLRVWPAYLLFLCTREEGRGRDLLLIKKQFKKLSAPSTDPLFLFKEYFHYFEIARRHPSPFLPKWAEALLAGSAEKLAKAMQKNDDHQGFDDLYLDWLQMRCPEPSTEALCQNWSSLLQRTFGGFDEWRKR